ncbi:MAG: hypothetical protein L0228_15830 [Planctomycetes bacterium]|nr:hypothetical protein [Planctomycetota bacterium]
MGEYINDVESRLAKDRLERLIYKLTWKRTVSYLLAIGFGLAGLGAVALGTSIIGMCGIAVCLLLILRAIDTTSHLDEARHRSTRALTPDLSHLYHKQENPPPQVSAQP